MARSLAGRVAALERQVVPPPADRRPDFDAMSDEQLDQWLASYQPPPLTPARVAWHQALHAADDDTLDRVLDHLRAHPSTRGPDPLGPAVAAILLRKDKPYVRPHR